MFSFKKNYLDIKKPFIVTSLVSLTVTLILTYFYTQNIDLKIAWGGWGPQDYINDAFNLANYAKNWPNGISVYKNSLPMQLLAMLVKSSGFDASAFIPYYMFAQILLFVLSIAHLSYVMFRDEFVVLLSVVIIPISNLAGINIARFGAGFGSSLQLPLYYGFSYAFGIFAISHFLQSRYIISFILLALTAYCHLTMGLFFFAFCVSYLLYNPNILSDKHHNIGLLCYCLLTAPFVFYVTAGSSPINNLMSPDEWIKITRIFSYHWYPITMNRFTESAHREFVPILILLVSYFTLFPYKSSNNEKNKKILAGITVCSVFTLFGIVFSDIYPISFLVRISLQRSSSLITFICTLCLIHYCWKQIQTKKMIQSLMALLVIATLIITKPGIAILPLCILFLCTDHKTHWKIIVFILIFIISSVNILDALTASNNKYLELMKDNLWSPLNYFNPLGKYDLLLFGGKVNISKQFALVSCLPVLLVIACFGKFASNSINNRVLQSFFLSFLVLLIIVDKNTINSDWERRKGEIYSSYYELQQWAKYNTPSDSLFLIDPAQPYGWRDYSQRSSFGNLREWVYLSVAYIPSQSLFDKGKNRLSEFGINLDDISTDDAKTLKYKVGGQKINKIVRSNYYSLSAKEITAIASKYKIDYIVMNRQYHTYNFSNLTIVYENKYFILYSVG